MLVKPLNLIPLSRSKVGGRLGFLRCAVLTNNLQFASCRHTTIATRCNSANSIFGTVLLEPDHGFANRRSWRRRYNHERADDCWKSGLHLSCADVVLVLRMDYTCDIALQKDNSGAWLWCSKDDKMLDAIRKASL